MEKINSDRKRETWKKLGLTCTGTKPLMQLLWGLTWEDGVLKGRFLRVLLIIVAGIFSFQMVTKNLQQFNQQLHARQPLFQIETVLSAPEIVLSPPANEIYKLIMQCVRDMVEGWASQSHALIGLITVFAAILPGRQSGQKLQWLYEKPMPNNFLQKWILHNLWITTLKYWVDVCIRQVWKMKTG